MTDIVDIGFRVDSTDLDAGHKKLDKMGDQSVTTERKINKSTKSMGDNFDLLSSKINLVSGAIATIATGAGIGSAIQANRMFEKSVSSLSAITGAVGDDLQYYKEQAAEIGRTTTLSASQAVEAFQLIASAKPDLLSNAQALTEVTKSAVTLAEASGGTLLLAEAAEAVGKALNQFQLDASKSVDVVNLLAESSRAGTAGVALVSEALKNAGAVANSMDVSLTETVAGIQALAKAGIDGAEGGTALRQVLSKLEATADKELQPTIVGLSGAIENLSKRNLSSIELMKMFGEEAQASAASILAQKETLFQLTASLEGTNTAFNQAATNVNNLDGDLKSLASVTEGLQIQFSDGLNPALRNTVQGVTELLSNADALVSAIEAAAAVVAVAATPALIAYTRAIQANIASQLIANTQAVRTVSALGQVTVAAGGATVATNALAIATRFLLGPWGLLLTAVSAAGIAYSITKDKSDLLTSSLEKQQSEADKLEKTYSRMTRAQLASTAVEARKELIAITIKQREVMQSLSDAEASTNDRARTVQIRMLAEELEGLNEQSTAQTEVLRMVNQVFTNGLPKIQTYKEKLEETKTVFSDLVGTDTVDLFALNQSKAYDQWIESIYQAANKVENLENEMGDVWAAMLGDDIDWDVGLTRIEQIQSEIDSFSKDLGSPFDSMIGGALDAANAMSGMFESGSKDAKKLAIAIQALNLVQAVGAVLNQGNGDPYTAFGRMAAMAGMVASLGASIGSLSGGLQDESAENQQNQGLNVWGEKSEAISDATEITANATQKLVGINTDMLKAMQGLTMALASASGIIARDLNIPQVSVNVMDNIFDGMQNLIIGDVLNLTGLLGETFTDLLYLPLNIIGSWLGGSSKVSDEGIRILGGSFSELMDDVTVQAFQSVSYKKWKFGSTKKKTSYTDISDDVGGQFALVFESIANSVATGAVALGLSADEIEKKINEFEIETTQISLLGLSAEEKQSEIEAVFGKIFSNLTDEVVPFAKDFQDVGEDLGATLARLATQAAIADEITERFGINFGDKFANPEAYTAAIDNLADLVGGVENLSEQTSSFTNAFATDAQKFDIYQKAMTSALSDVGLALPGTTEELYNLMGSIDGTTEEGRQQIAVLLGLTDTASEYYNLLDKTAGKYRDAAEGLYDVSFAVEKMSLDSAVAAARLGDFSLAEQLDLGALSPSQSSYATALDYDIARAETAAKLNELADLQSGTVTVDEKQLSVLEEIRDSLKSDDTIDDNNESLDNLGQQMEDLKSQFKVLSDQVQFGTLNVRLG